MTDRADPTPRARDRDIEPERQADGAGRARPARDRVDFSAEAYARLASEGPQREGRVAEFSQLYAEGLLNSPERLERTVLRLLGV